MAMYTKVNKETCIACAACGSCAPDVFEYDEEGLAGSGLDFNSGTEEVPEELEDDVMDAYDNCPSESILVQEEPFR